MGSNSFGSLPGVKNIIDSYRGKYTEITTAEDHAQRRLVFIDEHGKKRSLLGAGNGGVKEKVLANAIPHEVLQRHPTPDRKFDTPIKLWRFR